MPNKRDFDREYPYATHNLRYNAGMVVYIEYVVIDNTVITYCIAMLAYRLAGIRPRRWRAAVASVVGTAAALCYPLLGAAWAIWLLKLGLAVVLACILFVPGRVVRGGLFFLLSTAVFGGVTFLVGYLLTGSATKALVQPLDIPLAVPLLAGWGTYVLGRKLTAVVRRRRQTQTVRLSVTRRGRTVDCEAIVDTGNTVLDGDGLPVVVFTARVTAKILDDSEFTAVLLGREPAGGKYITAAGAGGKQKILTVPDAEIALYIGADKNIVKDVTPGLSLLRSPYGAILPSAAVKDAEISL